MGFVKSGKQRLFAKKTLGELLEYRETLSSIHNFFFSLINDIGCLKLLDSENTQKNTLIGKDILETVRVKSTHIVNAQARPFWSDNFPMVI